MTTRAATDHVAADTISSGAGSARAADNTGDAVEFSYNRRKLQNSQAARRFRAKRKEELKRMREEIATLKRENAEAHRLLVEVRKFCYTRDIGLRDFPSLHNIERLLTAWEEDDRSHSDNDGSSRSVDGPTYQTGSLDMSSLQHQHLGPHTSPSTAAGAGPMPTVRIPTALGLSSQNTSPLLTSAGPGAACFQQALAGSHQQLHGHARPEAHPHSRQVPPPPPPTATLSGARAPSDASRQSQAQPSSSGDSSSNNNNDNTNAAQDGSSNQNPSSSDAGRNSDGLVASTSGTNASGERTPLASSNGGANAMTKDGNSFVPPQNLGAALALSHGQTTTAAGPPVPVQGQSPLPATNALGAQSAPGFDLLGVQAGQEVAGLSSSVSSLLKQMATPGSSSITRLESKIADLEQRLLERIAELPEKFGGAAGSGSNKRPRRAATSS